MLPRTPCVSSAGCVGHTVLLKTASETQRANLMPSIDGNNGSLLAVACGRQNFVYPLIMLDSASC